MNISDIKHNYQIEEVIGRSIHLKKQGPEMVGTCPFHDDKHASLKVNPRNQIFKCFACGAVGDIFDFFTMQGHTIAEAKKLITNGQIITMPTYDSTPTEPEYVWENVICNQESLPNPLTFLHAKYNAQPNSCWPYHDKNGNVISFACRFDLPDGVKDVLPCTYSQKKYADGRISNLGWNWRKHSKPHPLYNLHELYQRPNDIVLVVEGEKAADAAKRLFPQYVCVTWLGGKDNVKYADWSPLEGRNVYLWADNDIPGILAMFGGWDNRDGKSVEYTRFKGVCEYVAANFKKINNSPDFPKKWDIADADWSPEQAIEYLKSNRSDVPLVSELPPNEKPAPVTPPPPPAHIISAPSPVTASEPEPEPRNTYFKCLGFENNDNNLYVFFVYRTNTIVKLSPGGLTISNLMQLAPLNYWEREYPKQQRSGAVKYELNTIVDHIITMSAKVGIFNPGKIRGRGAWIDNGVPVIHCGDKLIVNGIETDFAKHKSKFIYEAGQELGFELSQPLTASQANQLIQILERLNWDRSVSARLLAGWIVISMLCGALSWRSHMWLTGASGSGKSWVMISIIKRLLGHMAVNAQSSTTEAGIRQYLKADALPVVIDEAESENKKGEERVQAVLELMRASSTSDGGHIIKGSSGGSAALYDIKSCFAFASIGANLTQRSDASRITVLELKKDERANKEQLWSETKELYHSVINDEYVQAFQSRAIMKMPIILENAKVFSAAAAAELDNQRTGDQLGALLAGAYSLYSDNIISYEDAKKWIKERDWSEERLSESTRDEIKVLHKIMESEIRVETANSDNRSRTIGELINAAVGGKRDNLEELLITKERASETLSRIGILVEGKFILISDNSRTISRFVGAPYSLNYHSIISRISGAEKIDNVRFGSHMKSRATKISVSEIFGHTEEKPVINIIPPVTGNSQERINF